MNLGYAILVLTIWALAVMRLTRLINADTILDAPRLWIAARVKESKLAADEAHALGQTVRSDIFRRRQHRWAKTMYFVQCPWCVGMWLAFVTAWVPLYFHTSQVARYIALALACSHLIGVCARFADTEEIEIEDDDDE